jgi:hypothetical protein
LPADCHLVDFPRAPACTLDQAIANSCQPCDWLGAGTGGCALQPALVQGATYTYVQILNVDTADVLVYDATGALVAELYWGANPPPSCRWSCLEGPADFDPTEAEAVLPVIGSGSLQPVCAKRGGDGATD